MSRVTKTVGLYACWVWTNISYFLYTLSVTHCLNKFGVWWRMEALVTKI